MGKARAVRRTMIEMATRRQRPGYGSLLSRLEDEVFVEPWWRAVESALAEVPHAVIGGVAANAYMAPRLTRDLDVGVLPERLGLAEAALEAAGWRRGAPTRPTDPHLSGWTWVSPDGHTLDLFAMRHPWASAALHQTRADPRTGLPTLPMVHVVLMKMAVSRTTDIADLTRVLGGRSEEELREVREAVRRFGGPDDLDDLEQLIALGRLERDDR
jgi:hypothetical protein